jgi:hypothetical protein
MSFLLLEVFKTGLPQGLVDLLTNGGRVYTEQLHFLGGEKKVHILITFFCASVM